MIKGKIKQAHSSMSKIGSGDNYGVGLKNKVGRAIDVFGYTPIPNGKIKTPPKNLA